MINLIEEVQDHPECGGQQFQLAKVLNGNKYKTL